MTAPIEIQNLVARFEEHREDYLSGKYNEASIRSDFINPLFKALGWDMYNEKGKSEIYKEVIHEASIKVDKSVKAPDYSFRIGKDPVFFLEAKKPSVDIKGDPSPAYQLRRYAWTAKLAVSILTDFEEFAVYDAHVRPDQNDKSSVARVFYFTYKDYIERWDELVKLFSPEAITRGSLDKFAVSGKKKGTTEVDSEFLKEIENWRDLFAKNIALRNPDLTQRELNYAVQCTIDRIIFLRICEDRGIEPYERLKGLLKRENIYYYLCEIFREADNKYNSGLFHFEKEDQREHPDSLTLKLAIDGALITN